MSTPSSTRIGAEVPADRRDSGETGEISPAPTNPATPATGFARDEVGTVDLMDPSSAKDGSGRGGPRDDGGRFRILRPHAEGGLGRVSVAIDSELGREVALKQLRDSFADDPVRRAKFIVEAIVTGRLEHPGIVPIYALDRDESGRPYYAMRFIRGETLKEAVRRYHHGEEGARDRADAVLGLRMLLERFLVVCEAMEYAHSRGVVHRDLKPENVMLGAFGETLVVDWGVARLVDPGKETGGNTIGEEDLAALASAAQTLAGSRVGTPAYMSPEQARGEPDRIGPRTDVYGLGAILYEMLTGRAPIVGHDLATTLNMVSRGEIPRPKSKGRPIPAGLRSICRKAMALRPEDRYDSARALAADIRRWLADEPVAAHPEGMLRKSWRAFRRHQLRMTLIILALFMDAVIVLGAIFSYVQWTERIRANEKTSEWRARALKSEGRDDSWYAELNLDTGDDVLLVVLRLAIVPFALQAGGVLGLVAGAVLRRVLGRRGKHLPLLAALGGAGLAAGLVIVKLDPRSQFGIDLRAYLKRAASTPSGSEALMEVRPESRGIEPRLPYIARPIPAWVSAGAPFHVGAYLDRVRAAENRAGPYLEALMEFSPAVSPAFSASEGRRRASVAKRRIDLIRGLESRWNTARQTMDGVELGRDLEEFAVGFFLLDRAARGSQEVSLRGLDRDGEDPLRQVEEHLGSVFTLKVWREVESGDLDAAIADLGRILRLSAVLDRYMEIARPSDLAWTYCELLDLVLSRPRLERRQIDRLIEDRVAFDRERSRWRADCLRRAFLDGGMSLEAYLQDRLREYRLDLRRFTGPEGSSLPHEDGPSAELEALERLFRTDPESFAREARASYLETWRRILAADDVAPWDVSEGLIDRFFDRYALYSAGYWNWLSAHRAHLKSLRGLDAELSGAKCLLALRRCKEIRGRSVVGFEEVMHEIPDATIPRDPYRADLGPMRLVYRDGEPLIYSVGPDGVDDGGRGRPSGTDFSRFDLVYRIRPEVLLDYPEVHLAQSSRDLARWDGRPFADYRRALFLIEGVMEWRLRKAARSDRYDLPTFLGLEDLVAQGMAEWRSGRTHEAISTLSLIVEPKNRLPGNGSKMAPYWLAIARLYRARGFAQLGQIEEAERDLREVEYFSRGPGFRKLLPQHQESLGFQLRQAKAVITPDTLPADVFAPRAHRIGGRTDSGAARDDPGRCRAGLAADARLENEAIRA